MQITGFQQINRISISSRTNPIFTYLRGKNFSSLNDFAEKKFLHLYSLYSKVKNSLSENFPSLLVNKLIVFSSKYTKPVKNSCNGRMLRKKPSPFETTLNKNPPRPSNESSIFSSKLDLRNFYQPKSPSYQVWWPYALWTWT